MNRDPIFPTNNDYGIPMLNIALQSTNLEHPAIVYGTVARSKRMYGTWLFYCDDYRFEALWSKPDTLLKTGCTHIVEPNFSVYDNMPKAHALWNIFRKRWLSRYYQDYGNIHVTVDLNVSRVYAQDNLLGVPVGWRSYASRGYKERAYDLEWEYNLAKEHAQSDSILFVVYGGNRVSKEFAYKNGCVWINDQQTESKINE